jgi:uncharacterized Zn finger protein (UPF0148 family)
MAEPKRKIRKRKCKHLIPIYCGKCGKKLLNACFIQGELWCPVCGTKHKIKEEEVSVE